MNRLKGELVSFPTKDGLALPGLLFEPKRKTGKALVWLHGNGSSSVFYSTQRMNTIAQTITRKGIAFFPFNNRGAHYVKKLVRNRKGKPKSELYGMAFEKIKECIPDIDGAIAFLKKRGYKELYLEGHSTGANKICVYHYYNPKNDIAKYVLLGGGDDTGFNYQEIGKKNFNQWFKKSKEMIRNGKGKEIAPANPAWGQWLSWQSWYDTMNPNGDYNIFPFYESLFGIRLSKKKLFREYDSIDKPTLVLYGGKDEYCYGKVKEIVELLKQKCGAPEKFSFKIIPNADHSFHEKEKELAKTIAEWLVK